MKEKMLKRIMMLAAALLVCLGVPNVTARAESVTELKQTYASSSYVEISFATLAGARGYQVYYSSDNVNFYRTSESTSYDTSSGQESIFGLSAGRSYYVYVVPVYYNTTGNYDYTPDTSQRSDTLEVVTVPDEPQTVTQTAASSSSATFSWDASSGATGYYIKDSYGAVMNTVTGNSITFTGRESGSRLTFYVYPYRKSSSGYVAEGSSYKYGYGYTAPSAPQNIADADTNKISWRPGTSSKIYVYWNSNANDANYPDGYEVQIYSVDGKTKLKTIDTTHTYISFGSKKVKNKGFKIRIRSYLLIGQTKYYGDWSSYKTVVPQADVSLTQVAKTSMKVSWKKIANAAKYTVYVCTNINATNPTWKKVATVSKGKTSCTVKKLKSGKTIRFAVIPTVKVGGKKYTADRIYYTSGYLSKYY